MYEVDPYVKHNLKKERYENQSKAFDALNRLVENADFKYLFLERYCKEVPLEQLPLLTRNGTSELARENGILILSSIQKFKDYMDTIVTEGTTATQNMLVLEEDFKEELAMEMEDM